MTILNHLNGHALKIFTGFFAFSYKLLCSHRLG